MRNLHLSEATEAQRGRGAAALWNDVLRFSMREAGVAVALVLIVLFFCFTAAYFATPENFLKIFVQIAINTVLASGMTFVILTGGIDLSVGSVLALCTVVGALIMTDKDLPFIVSVPLALLGCMGVGALCGAVNGFVIEQWKVPSFIVTLGMLNVASGAARVTSNNSTITGLPQPFIDFGNMIVWGVFPSIFLVAVGVILIGWFILRFTVFGRFIYAIGTNEEAVRLSGHSPRIFKIAAFTISGLTPASQRWSISCASTSAVRSPASAMSSMRSRRSSSAAPASLAGRVRSSARWSAPAFCRS